MTICMWRRRVVTIHSVFTMHTLCKQLLAFELARVQLVQVLLRSP